MSSQKGKRKDDSDSNGPKRPMQRRVINRLSELDIPESYIILPEYQSEGVLDDMLEEFTYESMIEAAYYRPLFRQRFFGILDPLTKKDDIDESFVVADQLLVPQAFQVLLRKDFGIAAKPEDCSAKTFAFRELVAKSLERYAPTFNFVEGVSRLNQLTKFRELYIWLRAFGSTGSALRTTERKYRVYFKGDGIVEVENDGSGRLMHVSVVDLFLWIFGRIDKQRFHELRVPQILFQMSRTVPIKVERNFPFTSLDEVAEILTFRREKDAYFSHPISGDYMGYNEPTGLFRYDNGTDEAELIMVVNAQLVRKIGRHAIRFFPGYCMMIGFGGLYAISVDPKMRSIAIEAVSYVAFQDFHFDYFITKYIDTNGNVSPRVVQTYSFNTDGIFVVIDFPLGKAPIVRQYPYTYFKFGSAIIAQTNFLQLSSNTQALGTSIFDPSSGKIAKVIGGVGAKVRPQHQDESTFVVSTLPPIAFNFHNKDTPVSLFYGKPVQLIEEKLLHEKDLVVKRKGKFIFDVNVGPRLRDIDEEESEDFVPYDSDNDQ